MPMKLKCPACTDAVFAEDADRGTTIKCGTCWADVPVPKAEGSGPVPPPAAKPLPAKPLPPTAAPVAKALPPTPTAAPAAPPVAKAVPAQPVQPTTLNPVGGRRYDSRRDDDKPDRAKPKYKTRDYDDDDDDRPTRTPSGGGGGKGVLIAFICLGLVLAVGLAGGAFLLLRGNTDETTNTGPAPADNGGGFAGGGGGGPFPNPFDPPKPRIGGEPNRGDFNLGGGGLGGGKPSAERKGWVTFRGQGFELLAPARMTKSDHTFAHDGQFFKGDKYEAREGDGLEVHAWELGAQPVVKIATAEFVAACTFNVPEKVRRKDGVRPMTHGQPGVEFTTTEINHEHGAVLVTGTDKKVYVFRIRWKDTVADGERKKDDLLASIRIVEGGIDPDQLAGRPNFPKLPDAEDPKKPKRIVTPWKEVENKGGFVASAPPGVTREKHTLELDGGVFLSGAKYKVDDGQCAYWLSHYDLAPGQDLDLQKIAGKLVKDVFPHDINDHEDVKVDGKPATRWTIRHFHGGLSHGYTIKVGYRVFTFFVTSKQGIYGAGGDPTLEEREQKFLDSIKISFDPKTFNPYEGEPDWVAMTKTVGFAAAIPRQATSESDFRPIFGLDVPVGKGYKAEVDGMAYEAFVIDLSKPPLKRGATEDRSAAAVLKHVAGHEKLVSGPEKAKMGGHDAEHYVYQGWGNRPMLVRITAVGTVVFVLKVSHTGDWNKRAGDKEFADKSARFFDSFRVGTGATPGNLTAPGGGLAAGGGKTGDPVTPAGEFAQVAAGKVRPFWAAAFLPTANEFVTVGTRDPNATPPGGVVRRYSLPDFKLKATYHLNMPAHRAAADEKGGKLYLAMVSAAVDARKPEREAAIVAGDVHVYDLKKLLDGSLGDLEQLKPLTVMSVGGASTQVSGLEVSPSGDALFVSAVVTTGTKAKQSYRGKLTRFDTASGKSADLSCEFPVWAIKLAADGRRLAILERPIDPTGAVKGGTLALVDAVNWRRVKSVPLSGTPLDVAYLGSRPAALENNNGAVRLVVAEPDGENNEVPVDGDPLYVRATPDGKRVLLAAGLPANGLGLYDVDAAKPPKLTKKAAADLGGTPLGGLAAVSPDGKLAVLNAGVVLDLEKSGGR